MKYSRRCQVATHGIHMAYEPSKELTANPEFAQHGIVRKRLCFWGTIQ
jgi:hypothetical protein